jgi:hypothetical protein
MITYNHRTLDSTQYLYSADDIIIYNILFTYYYCHQEKVNLRIMKTCL